MFEQLSCKIVPTRQYYRQSPHRERHRRAVDLAVVVEPHDDDGRRRPSPYGSRNSVVLILFSLKTKRKKRARGIYEYTRTHVSKKVSKEEVGSKGE